MLEARRDGSAWWESIEDPLEQEEAAWLLGLSRALFVQLYKQ